MTTSHESHRPDPDEELLRAVLAEEEAALPEEHGRRDPISPAARTRLRGGTAGAPAPQDRPSVEDVYGPVDRPSAGLPGDPTADASVTGAPGAASVPAAGDGSPEVFIGADAETPADVQARHRRAQEAPPAAAPAPGEQPASADSAAEEPGHSALAQGLPRTGPDTAELRAVAESSPWGRLHLPETTGTVGIVPSAGRQWAAGEAPAAAETSADAAPAPEGGRRGALLVAEVALVAVVLLVLAIALTR